MKLPNPLIVIAGWLAAVCLAAACYKVESPQAMLETIGLSERKLASGESYLGKTHRGYETMVSGEAANVWLRFGARLAASQLSTELELGRAWEFILGGRRRSPVGSPFDRLLSKVLGRPLAITVLLKHEKPSAPRIDILSNFTGLAPDDLQPKAVVLHRELGLPVATLYGTDQALLAAIKQDEALLTRIKKFRSFYIRLDENVVSFVFAGNESEYSQMLSNYDYQISSLYLAIFDALADIADKIDKK